MMGVSPCTSRKASSSQVGADDSASLIEESPMPGILYVCACLYLVVLYTI